MKNKRFNITRNKGFHLCFSSGLTLSTQFGAGNYCDNYDSNDYEGKESAQSDDCEVAIWITDTNEWITEKLLECGDSVKGYISFDEWLSIVEKCKNWRPDENIS